MNPNPRRTFIKQSSLGILSLSVLDLIPSAQASDPKDPPSGCKDPNGNYTNTVSDETCNQNKNLSKDEACGASSGTVTEDQDAACGTTKAGVDDQDSSCNSTTTTGATTADEACDNGMVSNGQEPDQHCSKTEKDESCVQYQAAINKDNKDEHCGYGGTIPDPDHHCTGTNPTTADFDSTNYIS